MSGLEVVVPMKPLAMAKSRLALAVPDARRQAAVLLMLDWVLRAAARSVGPRRCRVVGGDGPVWRVAQEVGCRWEQEEGHDLNSSLQVAIGHRYAEGATAVLFLPGDLPQISTRDVATVAAASAGLTRPVVVAATADGGTNAILLPVARTFPPELGQGSFRRHVALAEATGVPPVIPEVPGLAFDVDTAGDLAWAVAHVRGFAQALARWEERLAVGAVRAGCAPLPEGRARG